MRVASSITAIASLVAGSASCGPVCGGGLEPLAPAPTESVAFPTPAVEELSAEPGGIWVDGDAATNPGCVDKWRAGDGPEQDGLVERFRAQPVGGLFRVPVDARAGDTFEHDIVCAAGANGTSGFTLDGAAHHVTAPTTPVRDAPVIRSATATPAPPTTFTGPTCAGVDLPSTQPAIDNTNVDVVVTSAAPELRLDVWAVAPGAPVPAESARRLGVATAVANTDGHITIAIARNGAFDVLLRFTDLQQGQTSDVFRLAGPSSCASTRDPMLIALALLVLRRARRRSRSRAQYPT